jgi:hypothetical protein
VSFSGITSHVDTRSALCCCCDILAEEGGDPRANAAAAPVAL